MTVVEVILLVVAISGWVAFGIMVGVTRDTLDLATEILSRIEIVEDDDEEKEESHD